MKFEHVIAGQESEDVTRIEWRVRTSCGKVHLEGRKAGGDWCFVTIVHADGEPVTYRGMSAKLGLKAPVING